MKKLEFELDIYTYQIDFSGHVSNIVYIQWMEMGRLKILEAVGFPVDRVAVDGVVPVLASTEIAYKNPLYLGDRVRVEVWLSKLRGASARMEFRFYNGEGVLAATGSQKGLFVHRESMRPQRLSPEMRAAFEPFVWAEAEERER